MLTRVYGIAFTSKEELDAYTAQLDEAKKRDHRVLGQQLKLFLFSPLVGPGLPLWTPRGTILRTEVDNFVQQLRKEYNYGRVTIPHFTKPDLYKKSQHYEKYGEDLFKVKTRDGHELCVKPMNCPHHAQIYASELRSYKELPIRYSETTMVYRDEQSGELAGLSRVLSITQDDAHVFCRESQLKDEMNNIWNLIEKFYSAFGFDSLTPRFSRRDDDPKFKGNIELWGKAEDAIRSLLEERAKGKWVDGEGEAAFYGPKIDFMAKDAIGRSHQVGTIQLDFVQPTNFGLEYVNEEGKREMPVMIHCAIAGSLERFLSVYIEHSAGNFPLWLAPTQIAVLPIAEKHHEYAKEATEKLKAIGLRVEFDDSKDGLGKKVRYHKEMKTPYWLVIGDKDIEAGKVTLESRDRGQLGQLTIEEIVNRFTEEIQTKS
jgi:threonyl-tRNA synthetase